MLRIFRPTIYIFRGSFFLHEKRHSDIDVQHELIVDVEIETYFQGRASMKLHVLQPFFTYIVDI